MEQKTKTTFNVGLKTAEHKTHIHPEEVIKVISEYITAGTFRETKGLWNGELENSLEFSCINLEEHLTVDAVDEIEQSNTDKPFKYLKNVLETEFDQESVAVTKEKVKAEF